MVRRVALVLALVTGAFWVLGTLVMDYPDKFSGAEGFTDSWRAPFQEENLAQTRDDVDAFGAFADQFTTEAVPALAAQLDMTPAQFSSFVAANYPDTAAGVAQLGTIAPYFDNVVGLMETHEQNAHKADQIPTKDLPATTVPWIFIGLGVLAVAAAVWGAVRLSARPAALAAIGVVGLVAILASLILSVPSKAQAVEDFTDDFRTAFTDAGVAQTRAYMDTVSNFAGEVSDEVLPGLATALGTTPDALATNLSTQFPAVGAVLADLPGLLARFEGLVSNVEASAEDFRLTDSIPTKGYNTTLLEAQLAVPGAILVLAGGGGLLIPALAARRRGVRRPVEAEVLAH